MDHPRTAYSGFPRILLLFILIGFSCVVADDSAGDAIQQNEMQNLSTLGNANTALDDLINPTPIISEEDTPFINALSDAGFTVQQGAVVKVDFIRMAELGLVPDAEGNNADNPYFCWALPPAPGQTIKNDNAYPNGFSRNFRLNPDEAVIMIGQTPPEVKFFSYPSDLIYRTIDGVRTWIFGGLDDTINIATVNAGDGNGDVISQPVMIIYSADQGTAEKVKSLAESSGYPESMINIMKLPSPMLHMGIDEDSDSFGLGVRAAVFADPAEKEAYMQNAYTMMRPYRVTPNESGTLDPYPVQELRIRGTGKTEFDLTPAVDKLRDAIINAYPDYSWEELKTGIAFPESNQMIQNGLNAFGENRDAVYLGSQNFTLGEDQFAVSYGVNHMAFGKAVYSNICAYGKEKVNGVVSVDSTQFEGSTDKYLGNDIDTRSLYAYTITRTNSTEPYTMVVPTGPGLRGIPLDQEMWIGWRAYMEPSTNVGPAYPELIYDRVIVFTPK